MSRAFVRESDLPDEPLFTPSTVLPPGAKNYLTPDGEKRLRAQLDELLHVTRPPLVQAGDDPDAKLELQKLDRQVRALQVSLQTAEVVAPPQENDGVVRFGSTVTIEEAGGAHSTYRLVGVDEMDLGQGWISWISPLARALLSAKKGDTVQFSSPAGPRKLKVIDVSYDEPKLEARD